MDFGASSSGLYEDPPRPESEGSARMENQMEIHRDSEIEVLLT